MDFEIYFTMQSMKGVQPISNPLKKVDSKIVATQCARLYELLLKVSDKLSDSIKEVDRDSATGLLQQLTEITTAVEAVSVGEQQSKNKIKPSPYVISKM